MTYQKMNYDDGKLNNVFLTEHGAIRRTKEIPLPEGTTIQKLSRMLMIQQHGTRPHELPNCRMYWDKKEGHWEAIYSGIVHVFRGFEDPQGRDEIVVSGWDMLDAKWP